MMEKNYCIEKKMHYKKSYRCFFLRARGKKRQLYERARYFSNFIKE
jgi:hypothetical protein